MLKTKFVSDILFVSFPFLCLRKIHREESRDYIFREYFQYNRMHFTLCNLHRCDERTTVGGRLRGSVIRFFFFFSFYIATSSKRLVKSSISLSLHLSLFSSLSFHFFHLFLSILLCDPFHDAGPVVLDSSRLVSSHRSHERKLPRAFPYGKRHLENESPRTRSRSSRHILFFSFSFCPLCLFRFLLYFFLSVFISAKIFQ